MAIHLAVLYIFLLSIALRGSFAQTSKRDLTYKGIDPEITNGMTHQMMSKSIDPSRVIQLSWHPRVFLYRGFLSEEECDYLISRGDATSKVDMNGVSDGISLDTDDEIGSRIEERISAWTFSPKENGKPLSVLQFGLEDSKLNYKYFHIKSSEKFSKLLFATVILYLSNVSRGGQIVFPESENKSWSDCGKSSYVLQPIKGNAILFFNLHPNNTLDRSSVHARCPVLDGELWCATKLVYRKSVIIEKNLPQSDDSNCSDEDENCPRWAALGECNRNSVFMVGSPDYYGTCRKSCNTC